MVRRWIKSGLWLLAAPLLCCSLYHRAQALSASAPVYVTLWFDTEDYILPQSDDAAKRLADALTDLGVRATFKVVGEKARAIGDFPPELLSVLQHIILSHHGEFAFGSPKLPVLKAGDGRIMPFPTRAG